MWVNDQKLFHEPRMSSTKERSVCDSNSQFSFVLAVPKLGFSSRANRAIFVKFLQRIGHRFWVVEVNQFAR